MLLRLLLRPRPSSYFNFSTRRVYRMTTSELHIPASTNGETTPAAKLSEDELLDQKYRPFLLKQSAEPDWVSSLELDAVTIKDDILHNHPKVQELRTLSQWSDGHLWCSPEQHGNLTAVFKNQIDWIPLATGSVRPTQGRTLAVVQVNGGSQSFNTVNSLRVLGRWMRMFTIPNQSSLPAAWTQFTEEGRLMPSGNRDRLVDVCEELVRVSLVLRPGFEMFADRFSERKEKRVKAEAEAAKVAKAEKEAAEVEAAEELKDVKVD